MWGLGRTTIAGAAILAGLAGAGAPALASGCPDGLVCGEISVPADRSGRQPGRLDLRYRVAEGEGPVLLLLAGGPGQPATGLVTKLNARIGTLAPGHRLAGFDQRGTGATAIQCPALQRRHLTDFTVRPPWVVRRCGESLGARRALYTTTATVADIEALRRRLGVGRMDVMGISYGTYVASRYARRHPGRVRRLVLDSVLPQENVDPFLRVHLRRAALVLRTFCRIRGCEGSADPARELHRVVTAPARRVAVPGRTRPVRVDGPALLDWLTTIASFKQEKLDDFTAGIHRASRGRYRRLARLGADVMRGFGPFPAEVQSWGLHAATLCSDMALPFPAGQGSLSARRTSLNRAASRMSARSTWPFDRRTAGGNGLLRSCLYWPRTSVAAPPKPGRLKPRTLLLAGEFDLSTPAGYARRELGRTDHGRLIVVPGGGHSVAFRVSCAGEALGRFLAGTLHGNPCRGGSDRGSPSATSESEPLPHHRGYDLQVGPSTKEIGRR